VSEPTAAPLEPEALRRPLVELLPPPGASPANDPREVKPRYLFALSLFLLSLFSATTLGAVYVLLTRTDVTTGLDLLLTPAAIRAVWGDPALLAQGFLFSASALGILLVHELGHYLTCRRYRLPVTLPYFLPSPVALGTFGAFIRIRRQLSSKRELFDVGVAGPIAGFVALVPALLYGVARSRIVPLTAVARAEPVVLIVPGHPLAFELAVRAFHGPVPSGSILEPHPLALAAWLGLFATSLNLLPLGQLDGGHLLYAVFGRRQRQLARPLWVILAALTFVWPGWGLWSLITLAIGLRHPPVIDEAQPLDARRRALAIFALVILILSFTPLPMREIVIPALR